MRVYQAIRGRARLSPSLSLSSLAFLSLLSFLVLLHHPSSLVHAQEPLPSVTLPWIGVNPAVILTLDGSTTAAPRRALHEHTEAFQKLTGGIIVVNTVNNYRELYTSVRDDLKRNTTFLYDGSVVSSQWLHDYAPNLVDLTTPMGSDPDLAYSQDIPMYFRNLGDVSPEIVGMPLDGDFHIIYYRADLLNERGLEPPRTWEDYLNIASIFHGQDLNDDSFADFGSCMPFKTGSIAYSVLYSIAASILQTRPSDGLFFDPATMEPRIDNDGYRLALEIYRNMTNFGPQHSEDDPESKYRDYFVDGRCALAIDWGDLGPLSVMANSRVRFKTLASRMFGSRIVYHNGSLTECNADICPFADYDLTVNFAPFGAFGGWFATINKNSEGLKQEMLYDFFSFVSQNSDTDVTSGNSPFNPYRRSTFENPSLWLDAGFTNDFSDSYLKALSNSGSFTSNRSPDLMIPGVTRYLWDSLEPRLAALVAPSRNRASRMTQAGPDLDTFTREVAGEWSGITDELGMFEQRNLYRESIGLQAIQPVIDDVSDPDVKSEPDNGDDGNDDGNGDKGSNGNNNGNGSGDNGGSSSFDWLLLVFMPALLAAVACCVVVAIIAVFVIRRKRKLRKIGKAAVLREQAEKEQGFWIDYEQLDIQEHIGGGAFGEVHRAGYRGTDVAVKKLRLRLRTNAKKTEQFVHEVSVMTELRHPNVLLFMGACMEPPCLVTEYMPRGSLYDVLHNETIVLDWKLIKNMAVDAAKGMDYLHSNSPPILHRDFKSLNLLVDQKWNLKVSDFGLTVFKDNLHTRERNLGSLLWTAPEVLCGGLFTEKSDVYSYGIVLWELLTRRDPYEGMNIAHVALIVRDGRRPHLPDTLNKDVVELIEDCWHDDPEHRPTFKQIRVRLAEMDRPTLLPSSGGALSLSFCAAAANNESNSVLLPVHTPVPPPSGEVSVMFTDIYGYARLWEQMPNSMRGALELHNRIIRRAIRESDGYEVKTESDSFMIAFQEPLDAARCCLLAQDALLGASWPKEILEHDLCKEVRDFNGVVVLRGLRVRMGLNIGEPHRTTDILTGRTDYLGVAVNRAAKIASLAGGGEVLMSRDLCLAIKTDLDYLDDPDVTEVDAEQIGKEPGSAPLFRICAQSLATRPYESVSWESCVSGNNAMLSPTNDRMLERVSNRLQRWIIPFEELHISRKIGEGSFGEVFKGKWRASTVAVKKFFRQHSHDDIMLELRKESVIMSELRHPNILLFMGACVESPNLCIVTEYMKHGSVGRFLRRHHKKSMQAGAPALTPALSWRKRLGMAKSTAIGMDYLHSFRPPLIHRDLSSYNIMVDKNLIVKIGDFGLARIKAQNATMTRCGTAAWTAPEVMSGQDYTEKTDVYSFGIVMWEFYTMEKPYRGLDLMTIAQQVTENGTRPTIPDDCPTEYAKLMQECWSRDPDARPPFEQIAVRLQTIEEVMRFAEGGAVVVSDDDEDMRLSTDDSINSDD